MYLTDELLTDELLILTDKLLILTGKLLIDK
jgi:hypothetical protein